MSSTFHIQRIRQKRLKQERRTSFRKLGLGCSLAASLILVPVIFAALAGYTSLTRDLPSLQELTVLLNPPGGSLLQPTRIYDRTGTYLLLSLEDPGAVDRQYVTLANLPQDLIEAYLAIFEPGFWESPGYSLEGIWENNSQASTNRPIAQRLVSDLLLWQEEPTLRRQLRERLLAAQVITHYGHEQVLEWSMNSVQLGPLIYGVDAAARVFFNKSAEDLNLAESTFMAAAALSPELNPLEVPQVVIEQRHAVLEFMLQQGWITPEEFSQADLPTLTLRDPVPPTNLAPAFTNLVLEQLSDHFPMARVQRGGLRVITSLDYDLQIQALCTSNAHLARLRGIQSTENAINGQPCEAARLLPTLPVDEQAIGDGLAVNTLVLEPATSQILAMTGEPVSGLDPAHAPGHISGSLLTPFVYLTGFTRGLSPASLVWDLPPVQPVSTESQNNAIAISTYHGPLRLRTALVNDYLAPAQQLVQQLGADTILQLTQELGLRSLSSLPAGTTSVFDQPIVMLELAHTYSLFANLGTLAGQPKGTENLHGNTQPTLQPAAVIRLEDLAGDIWLDWSIPHKQAILAPQLAYLMTDILSDETARWPSLGHPNPLEIGRPAGAKLGVASDGSSAWSLGFTPQRLTVVWIGYTQVNQAQVTAEMPAALWHALMQYATRGLPSLDWERPEGISTVAVCDPSGMLPTRICPNIVDEIFLKGSEPVQTDSLYQTFQVNRETGQLATVFTPADMVEERVYLVVPADAMEWARETGVPIPPDSYDPIYVVPSTSENARIDSPAMFGHVAGEVKVTGSAGGEGFAFYRLQAGQGLNPHSWLQIGKDTTTPVNDDLLGTWPTTGLNGLYTLQLLVVRQDQSVEKAVLQLTVDNTPPQISILQPADGQQIKLQAGLKVLLQVEATDDLQLARLEYYIDERLVATLVEAPFNILWQAQPGQHQLRVIAYDLAGNSTQAELAFELMP